MREHIADESVDLVYLDPPFNSNATYNVLFKAPDGHGSQAQIEAFDDTWHWSETAEDAYWQVLRGANTDAAKVLEAMRGFLGENDMMAYLAMMAIRLIELHRVLKPTGSLYLHCDPTASHYIKVMMDGIFGHGNFLNEIVWGYRTGGVSKRWFGRKHDVLLLYAAKFGRHTFNLQKERSYSTSSPPGFKGIKKFRDKNGRYYTMASMRDVWEINAVGRTSKERLGYPTQKPVALLERIISASSNEGDVVLDPFCGCGTTVHAAQKLDRRWIGIDVTHLAVSLIERRLRDAFGAEAEFATYGIPKSVDAARDLAARDKHEFEKWAITLIPDARPFRGGRKGADTGIDGIVYLRTGKNRTDKAIIEVKGGGVSVDQIHKLKSVVEREKALTGIFITLKEPTRPMIAEAAAAGFVEVDMGAGTQRYPVIQILTVEDMLERYRTLRLPIIDAGGFRKAPRERRAGQESMDL